MEVAVEASSGGAGHCGDRVCRGGRMQVPSMDRCSIGKGPVKVPEETGVSRKDQERNPCFRCRLTPSGGWNVHGGQACKLGPEVASPLSTPQNLWADQLSTSCSYLVSAEHNSEVTFRAFFVISIRYLHLCLT